MDAWRPWLLGPGGTGQYTAYYHSAGTILDPSICLDSFLVSPLAVDQCMVVAVTGRQNKISKASQMHGNINGILQLDDFELENHWF